MVIERVIVPPERPAVGQASTAAHGEPDGDAVGTREDQDQLGGDELQQPGEASRAGPGLDRSGYRGATAVLRRACRFDVGQRNGLGIGLGHTGFPVEGVAAPTISGSNWAACTPRVSRRPAGLIEYTRCTLVG